MKDAHKLAIRDAMKRLDERQLKALRMVAGALEWEDDYEVANAVTKTINDFE